MWKKRILCLILVICAMLLASCQQQQQTYPNQPRANTAAPASAAPTAEPQQITTDTSGSTTINWDSGEYNPAAEENSQDEQISTASATTPAPTMRSEYAGATPVVIDPIDKPTPTPMPELKFSFSTYEAAALHLTFKAPSGWIVDDSAADSYTLTDPDRNMDYPANMVIRVVPVNKQYSMAELKKEVKGALETMKADYAKFQSYDIDTRGFIEGNGAFAIYNATLHDGREIAGRIMINCVNKNLYILNCSYPYGLRETYKENLYNKVRSTMKLVR